MQPPPELGTQAIVRFNLIRKQGISACRRRIENIKKCGTGWLFLVRHVRMPGDGICPRREKSHSGIVVSTTVNKMHFWKAFRSATSRVNVKTPKVGAIV